MSSSPLTPAQAFQQVFNLRAIAAVFYFCLAVAVSRALSWWMPEQALGDWLVSLTRFTRQTLITGLLLLLAAALAEAWLQSGTSGGVRRRPMVVRGLAVLGAAALSTVARHYVANYGDTSAQWKWSWAISTTLLWVLLGGVAYGLLHAARAERLARQQLLATARQHEVLQAQQLEAQLSALNAQIEPHFLFNTLANVKRLYETAPERGRDMLVSLIAYLRAALPSMRKSESTLGQELELVRSYLTILQMRMGERLDFDIEAEPALLGARLPPMVLPTLVENAIKHGLSPLPEGGRISISARQHEDELALEVRDNGRGFAASAGSGVGLANTRARLAALFGGRAALELEAAEPRGVVARVRLPLAGGGGLSAVLPAGTAHQAGGFEHLLGAWRSLRWRELGWFTLMGLLYGLIDLSALVYVGDSQQWLLALTRQLFSPVIVTLILMLFWLPAARSAWEHPHRARRLALATLLGSAVALLGLQLLVRSLEWPSIYDLMRLKKGETLPMPLRWNHFIGDWLSIFIPSMLTVALFELLERRERTQARLQQLLHEQSTMARRAMAARLAAMQAQVEPQFLFDTLVDVERAYAAGDAEAAAQMERLIRHLRVALPRLREQGGTLESEAELLESYLAVLAGRRQQAVHFSADWPAALRGTALPPMLLLPLVQRALRLAAPRLPGRCGLSAEPLAGGGLRLLLTLDLPELCGEDAELQALSERLQALSGGPAELRCRSSEDATLFTLELKPCEA